MSTYQTDEVEIRIDGEPLRGFAEVPEGEVYSLAGETYTLKLAVQAAEGSCQIPQQNRDGLTVAGALRRVISDVNGPLAPPRKRPKRLAKKLAKRGGYMRTRGMTQAFLAVYPRMAQYFEGRKR